MYRRPLLPPGFAPPLRVEGGAFTLRPLRLADAESDFEAVMASAATLRGAMDPDSRWPEGLTLHENRVDLGWHEREFTQGHSFAYTVVAPDESRTLGCAYVYPSDRAGFAAMAFWWVRPDSREGLDAAVGAAFRAMVAAWPLAPVAYPGRDQPWAAWRALPVGPGAAHAATP
ncbi:hypothetical protein [Rubrimonas cliftonensis]|uniref:N-acetyltransferase domain-containing protein n=1 Tax=Rubrimonas cliftonensis TaxID=89524 RepID=A0A1H3VJT8_9RHOB|nr:hypothetical protein [Rubrimonas cliftonensis]SDZ75063.1 hypothetical protein SAMN05444370_101160 [Rubrimonas cliftonensis]